MQRALLAGTAVPIPDRFGQAVHLDGGTIFVGGTHIGGYAFAFDQGHVSADPGLATPGSLARLIGRVTTEHLNVRAGPGTEFEVVRKLDLGADVTLVGQADGWVALDSGGWVFYSSEWIDLEDDLELLQVLSPDVGEAESAS